MHHHFVHCWLRRTDRTQEPNSASQPYHLPYFFWLCSAHQLFHLKRIAPFIQRARNLFKPFPVRGRHDFSSLAIISQRKKVIVRAIVEFITKRGFPFRSSLCRKPKKVFTERSPIFVNYRQGSATVFRGRRPGSYDFIRSKKGCNHHTVLLENIRTPPFYLYHTTPPKIAKAKPIAACTSTKLNTLGGTPEIK